MVHGKGYDGGLTTSLFNVPTSLYFLYLSPQTSIMKKFFFSFLLLSSVAVQAQDAEIKPAAKGVVYGAAVSEQGFPVTPDELQAKMAKGVFEGKVSGRVTEVCKSMGCWVKLQKADGSTLMVTAKDHAFFMPANIVGKIVVAEGTASAQQVGEAKRRHLADDAGKSKKEQRKIKGAATDVQFAAKGVAVLD